MTKFDFKQWRVERKMTQAQAAELFGASPSFWCNLENGEENKKSKAIQRALSFYDSHWKLLCSMAYELTPGDIKRFVASQKKENGHTVRSLSESCGLSKSYLSNMHNENIDFSKISRYVKLMICARIFELNGIKPDPIEKKTTDVTVVSKPIKVITETQVSPDDFERIEYILIDGRPMWRLADVCRAIDYKNPSDAKKLVRSSDIEKSTTTNSNGQIVEQWLVNEYGLLRILAKANTPKTDAFERWVFEEVIPNAYQEKQPVVVIEQKAPSIVTALELQLQAAKQIEAQQRQLDEMQQRVQKLEQRPQTQGASADVVVDKLMEIDSLKTELHNTVHELVGIARRLPKHHPMRDDYSSYPKVWAKAFKAASPPVSKKAEYRKESQILPSLDVLRTALAFIKSTTLPDVVPATPSQLSFEIN